MSTSSISNIALLMKHQSHFQISTQQTI